MALAVISACGNSFLCISALHCALPQGRDSNGSVLSRKCVYMAVFILILLLVPCKVSTMERLLVVLM